LLELNTFKPLGLHDLLGLSNLGFSPLAATTTTTTNTNTNGTVKPATP